MTATSHISMLEVIGYLTVVTFLGLLVYTATSLACSVGSAVRVARWYWREIADPDEQPPDKFIVRVGLWRCR